MKILRPRSLPIFPFSNGLVLHRPGSQQLVVINTTAALVWCLLPEVDSVEELIARLVNDYGADPTAAPATVDLSLAEFADLGLLEGTDLPVEPSPELFRLPSGDNRPLPHPIKQPVNFIFALPGRSFKITYNDRNLGGYLAGAFGHLDASGIGDQLLEISITGQGPAKHDIYLDDQRRVAALETREVLPWLFALVFEECCENLEEFQLLHAGVLVRDGKAVLLAGQTGTGKTTLTAALAANGWQYFSDELARIDSASCRVRSFPQAMVIKSGSLPSLRRYYPGLADLPGHRRIDGRTVRFLPPAIADPAGGKAGAMKIGTLFFPAYLPQVKAECLLLTPVEALQRLAAAGSSQRALTGPDIEALIHLADTRPCYALYFADLETAMAMIEEKVKEKS